MQSVNKLDNNKEYRMAKSRGVMLAEQQASRGQVVLETEDGVTKEAIIKQLRASGVSANKSEKLSNLKKKLATTQVEG